MRIPSGVTDQYLYFVAVDATDYVTRETGLSSFTVYRSRNGGAATAYTTPTINQTSSSNMPGVYELLLDEDMTIDSGDDSQEVCLHITHAGMAPVTRVFELYRPKVTAGETLNVSSGALNAISDGLLTAAKFGTDCITAAKVAADVGTEIATAVWAATTRLLTAGTNIVLAKGTGITGFNDISTAQVNSEVDSALADYDPPTKAELDSAVSPLATASALSTVAGYLDTEIAAILEDTGTTIPGQIAALNNLSAADVNAEVDAALADYDGPTNTEMVAAFTEIKGATWASTDTLEAIRDRGDAAWTTATGFSTHSAADVWSAGTRTLTAGTNIVLAKGTGVTGFNDLSAAQVNAEVDTALGDYDGPTKAEMDDAFTEIKGATFDTTDTLEAIRNRGDAAWITATGFSTHAAADVWSVETRTLTAGTNLPTAAGIADAVWEEAIADHSGTTGSTAEALNAAGSGGDPWNTAIPGAYEAGKAGYIVGTLIDAAVSTRMATTHIDATDGVVDHVTLVDTTTTNTDMRGTDSAALASSLATTDGKIDSILTDTGTTLDGKIDAILADTGITLDGKIDAIDAAISGLNDISAADVNAQVVDALATDTYAEPGQGAPGATVSLAAKIGYIYKFLRNKVTQTSGDFQVYNDAGNTVDHKATVTDDGTTFQRSEIVGGP